MGLKIKNNARGIIAAPSSAGDTMIRVQTGQGARFPELIEDGDWFPLAATNDTGAVEIMRATTRIGDTIIVTREQEGTKALDLLSGDAVYLPMTEASYAELLGAAGPLALSISDADVTA